MMRKKELKKRGRGKPPIINSPNEMQIKIDTYFNKCKEDKEPLTITGLAIALGFASRQSFLDYSEKNEQYSDIIKRAKFVVENSYEKRLNEPYPTGAIFVLKNLGWEDRQDVKHTMEGQGRIFSNMELATRLSFLIHLALKRKAEAERIEGQETKKLTEKLNEGKGG